MPTTALKCIACNTEMLPFLEQMFDDRYGFPGYFDIYQCPGCKQCQTTPLLRDEDLPDLYGKYYPRREIDIEALVKQIGDPCDPSEMRRRQRNGTDNQGQYLTRPGMSVLDYGCGAGASLLEIKALGAEAYGIEADPNVKQVIDALGLRIHIGTLDDMPFAGMKFDLIVLNQVLEHIPHPELLLARFTQLLKPGGKLVLSFPNAGSVFARFFKRTWINWHIPYHLHHFNPRSARKFLERCNWQVRSVRTITPNLWTVLQCRAAIETTSMGAPNSMWTGKLAKPNQDSPKTASPWLLNTLRKFALSVSRPIPNAVLTFFNRFIDRLGLGDSILIELEYHDLPAAAGK
jgi:SAM-dependent methyltransferase